MASQPYNTRQHEAEAAALALLFASRRYNLPAILRQQGIKPRPFRRISPTEAIRYDLAAPHYAVVNAWRAEMPAILRAYLSGDATATQRAIDDAARRAETTVRQAQSRFPAALQSVERWHRAQWAQRVRTATTLDVGMFTSSQDVAPTVAALTTWNRQLADDIHQQTKGKLSAAFLGALAVAAPIADAKARAADVIAKAKRRAAGIGADMGDKASGGMTRNRMAAAGLTRWMWQHNTVENFRPEHKLRNGRVYNDETAPSELPGVLPFCRCVEIPLFE